MRVAIPPRALGGRQQKLFCGKIAFARGGQLTEGGDCRGIVVEVDIILTPIIEINEKDGALGIARGGDARARPIRIAANHVDIGDIALHRSDVAIQILCL